MQQLISKQGFVKVRIFYTTDYPLYANNLLLKHVFNEKKPVKEHVVALIKAKEASTDKHLLEDALSRLKSLGVVPADAVYADVKFLVDEDPALGYVIEGNVKRANEMVDVPQSLIDALEEVGSILMDKDSGPQLSGWENKPSENDNKATQILRMWLDKLKKTTKLKLLGSGSSRVVFAVTDELVLKVARSMPGVAQNHEEYSTYKSLSDCSIITRIFYYQDKFQWLLSERVHRQAKDSDFKIYGEGINNPRDLCQLARNVKRGKAIAPKGAEKDIRDLIKILDNMPRMSDELDYLNQWGIVHRNGQQYPVLVDYGFTNKSSQYYM